MNEKPQQSTTGKLVAKLALTVVAMFGFGFAMVPLYDVFCEITGLNGKTGGKEVYEATTAEIDTTRVVTVQFASTNNGAMSWEFHPMQNSIEVHPGELNEVKFFARNPSAARVVGQAVPSVSPSIGAEYLHKTECFCFTQQVLEAGESIEMPVRFFVDKALPADVNKMTLSYTLFDVTTNFASEPQLTAN
ncbi:MAG: cytochrome c oxidase assembly protein [Pseudomonadota bacterium]